MNIRVDEDKCCGYAACLSVAPELFDLADDNIAVVLNPTPGAELQGAAREAAGTCPTEAIVIEE